MNPQLTASQGLYSVPCGFVAGELESVRPIVDVYSINTAEEICAACRSAIALAPRTYPPDQPTSKDLAGAPAWYDFELTAWQIGERIRQTLAAKPRLRRDTKVQECLLAVLEYPNLRRGRQPFVTNLGYIAARARASRIATFLRDKDIDGQVIHTLLKMKAPGFASEVAPLLHAQHTWIRNLAKKYLARYAARAV